MDARHLDAVGVVGHLSRRYVNRRTGDAVLVLLLCGKPGDVAVHTPDVCYEAAGYARDGGVEPLRPGGVPDAELFTARFRRGGAAPHPPRVYWTGGGGGGRQGPPNPPPGPPRAGAPPQPCPGPPQTPPGPPA